MPVPALNVSTANLEKLRCATCKGYLSCSPICLLPDGNSSCGKCSLLENATVSHRQLALEAVMSNATFPCKNKQYGCDQELKFGCTLDHETSCSFRPVCCATLPFSECTWGGSVSQMPEHFIAKHSSLTQAQPKIKLEVGRSSKGILIVKGDCVFVVIYDYRDETCSLWYSVKHFTTTADDARCKLQVTSDSEPDYQIQVIGVKCLRYDPDDFAVQAKPDLNLNKLLKILNNPERVVVTFNAAISSTEISVNYSLLESMKCYKCNYYLIPPVYWDSGPYACANCYYVIESCARSRNSRHCILDDTYFPCRWRDCEHIAKGSAIRKHEKNCEFRLYRCLVPTCIATCKRDAIIPHMQKHKYKYFEDKFEYNTTLGCAMNVINAFTIVQDELVLVELSTTVPNVRGSNCISVQNSSFNKNEFSGYVRFEHGHCKVKSKQFTAASLEKVEHSDLPPCFKRNEPVVATLTVS